MVPCILISRPVSEVESYSRELNSDAETSELMRLTDSTTEKNATLDPKRTERADGSD